MSQYFDGKVYIEPSSAAKIITNVAPSPNFVATGVVAVIGESKGGLTYEDNTVYSSTQPNFLKEIMKDGVAKRCVDFIFNPSIQYPGANKVIFVRAQKATKATITITQTVTETTTTLVLTTKDKGAYLSDANNGYLWKLVAGTVDSAKDVLMLKFEGNVIWTSPECSTFQDLINAIQNNTFVSSLFTVALTAGSASTEIDNSARTGSYAAAVGGTSPSMTGTDVDGALALLTTLGADHYFIADSTNTNHAKVASFVNNVCERKAIAFFGGAANETVSQVKVRASAFNTENTILCYPDIFVAKEDGSGSESLSPVYFAAMCCGLSAGLPTEMPLTYKTVNVLGFNPVEGEMSKAVREDLIKAGVLVGRNIPGIGLGINKGVNTLQNNGSMIYKTQNGDATSPEISIVKIKYQIISELMLNATKLFLGGTAASVSKEDVINFVKAYLNSRTSTFTQPNLLLSFKDVTAELKDDAWYVWFGFVPNTPINHVFFTGAMLKP